MNKYNFELLETSMIYRGKMLHYMSMLELVMNIYIANHFCGKDNDKINDMQLLILGDDRMSFKSKMDVFIFIAKKYDSEWYKTYKGVGKELRVDLTHAMEQRNVFAHRVADNEDSPLSGQKLDKAIVRYVSYKNSIGTEEYGNEKFIALLTMVVDMSKFIAERWIKDAI
jgi:hypothetical protein